MWQAIILIVWIVSMIINYLLVLRVVAKRDNVSLLNIVIAIVISTLLAPLTAIWITIYWMDNVKFNVKKEKQDGSGH